MKPAREPDDRTCMRVVLALVAFSSFLNQASAGVIGEARLETSVMATSFYQEESGGCEQQGTVSASVGPCTWSMSGYNFTGGGQAESGYGVFRASAFIEGVAPALSWAGATATTHSYDYLKFSGPSPAYVQLVYDITGSTQGQNIVTLYVSWNFNTVASPILTSDTTVTSSLIPIVPGVEYSLYQQFHILTGAETDQEMDISGRGDFFNTVRLRPLVVTDALGNPLPGYTLETASGYDYFGDTSVPEPGTSALILLGGAMLAGIRRRHRSR
jgi:hypothetical protein